ncbi:MAG: hypothetical protein HY784_15805, partial [Chloroflexi bacterium]|nr:hypothetical protein [Chloroflexota bacterium]
SSWTVIQMDHTGLSDCRACHAGDAPPGHYAGQCSNCHTSTTTWSQWTMNHTGLTDCRACHAGDAPPGHYAGQCSNCHKSTTDWRVIQMDHTGLSDCQACHAGDAPPCHYAGQCSACPSTTAWLPANFNHTFPTNHGGANNNCTRCHPGDDYNTYTCFGCHDQSEMNREHRDVRDYDPNNCAVCHPDGREHD